jgi:hypothetical protein
MDEAIDGLQFQKAETPAKSCGQCVGPIADQYYQAAGVDICPECADKVTNTQARPANRLVLRGVLYGMGAAFVCSIGYALISWVTNMEIGLIAILVGYLVGQAIRRGSDGMGGRRCQVAAIILTYLAITCSYMPALVKGMRDANDKTVAEAKAASAAAVKEEPLTPAGWAIGIVLLFAIALAVPFLALAEGFSGIIGIAIIFFGLQRAWQQTARDERLLMGPYSTAGEAASA